MSWTRQTPLVGVGGDVGGDVQVGESFTARWVRELDGGLFGVVTRYFYVAEGDRHFVEQQTEYVICDDPSDPGGTERWSDADYVEVDARSGVDDATARRAAEDSQAPTDAEWSRVAPSWAGAAR